MTISRLSECMSPRILRAAHADQDAAATYRRMQGWPWQYKIQFYERGVHPVPSAASAVSWRGAAQNRHDTAQQRVRADPVGHRRVGAAKQVPLYSFADGDYLSGHRSEDPFFSVWTSRKSSNPSSCRSATSASTGLKKPTSSPAKRRSATSSSPRCAAESSP